MGCSWSNGRRCPPRPESITSNNLTLHTTNPTPQPNIQAPNAPHPHPQEQGHIETPKPGDKSPDGPSSLAGSAIRTDEDKVIITSIRATNVALGLRRIPAGFYAIVYHKGLEWRTENKQVLVNNDAVEWHGPIPIPSDSLAILDLEIYASFELHSILGNGERLRKLAITVEHLLECTKRDPVFTFPPGNDDDVFPCSSVSMTVSKRTGGHDSEPCTSVLRVLDRDSSTAQLYRAINQGHDALSHYRKYGEKRDLECSIEEFERALNLCPLNHPCYAAAQSNLAMAKFIHYQVGNTGISLDIPLTLYHDVLSSRPAGHPDRPSTLIQLAMVHFTQFERQRNEADAVQAEALLHEAKDTSIEESHENRAALFMLGLHSGRERGKPAIEPDPASRLKDEDSLASGMRLLDRFEQSGVLDDLQHAILKLEIFISSATVRDGKYFAGVINFGMAILHRFNCLGELGDLNRAISMFTDAIDLTPDGHPRKPGCISNLGSALLTRFELLQRLDDLEQAISSFSDAVDLVPDGHPHKFNYLSNLGNSFLTRFESLGKPVDAERAISRFEDALGLTPDGHPSRAICINNLGNSFSARFVRLGESSDLEQAISMFRDAVALAPDGNPHKPGFLTNLGNAWFGRFERFGELSDLQQAILRHEDAVDNTPDGHPEKPARLNNLGNSFQSRFDRLGQLDDLEQAISRFTGAVDLTSDGTPHKRGYLNNLGNSFLARYTCLGALSDLEQAVSRSKDAVDLTPDGHSNKPGYLSDFGRCLSARFERFGELEDLDQAISRHKDAVDLTPDGHPGKPGRLHILGISLKARFERLGQLSDLEQAILKHRDAISLTPHNHPDKPGYLNSLGNSLRTRFERLGELSDIEEAIVGQEHAVNLTPDGHPDKAGYMDSLGGSFSIRFGRLGELGDLEQAISKFRGAIDERPLSPVYVNNHGSSLFIRFERLGELADLEQAISRYRDAVELIPDGHHHKPRSLANLGNSLKARFELLQEHSDLEQAISRHMDAVNIVPDDHPGKPGLLNHLGTSLYTRFEHFGGLSDLQQAILKYTDAVSLTSNGHPEKLGYLNNLGNSFRARFERLGESSDILDAIARHEDAISLSPSGHPENSGRLNNLGNCYRTRFERLGQPSDLEQAISKFKDAVDLSPDGHPDKPGCLNNLGSSFFTRFKRLRESGDLERAISAYSRAACAPTGPTVVRFHASQQWISCARSLAHPSLLEAHSSAIGHLPQVAWIGLPLTHRYRELLRGADVVREAAAAALDLGLLRTAVEWLEQGRSIVWGGLLQLRSSYEELSSHHPDHAVRLRQLSAELEHATVTREKSLSLFSDHIHSPDYASETLEHEADRHRKIAIERDQLLKEIRGLHGFERFLLHKEFSQLRALAHSGPIVVLNAAENRCDALIVLADMDDVIHVGPLPNFTLKRSEGLQTSLKSLIRREGNRLQPDHTRKWNAILSMLWKSVVKPVLDALKISQTPGSPSRIFWCPTGPFTFLPIHAAGLYDEQHSQPGHKASDFIVSSYVPTLGILAPSSEPDSTSSRDLRFLAVRQPSSDGLSELPGVYEEIKYIKAATQPSASSRITLVEPSVSTVEEVLGLMKEADWVHFACHGIQDDEKPTDSGLCLADQRRLTLADMIALSRPQGGLAFLSACETATGDKGLSDEAIHIAAGMLFAGYRGVIATLWSISDRIAPRVAKDVYEQLFQGNTRADSRNAARALQDAVGRVRDGGASFDEWLPFIHVGL